MQINSGIIDILKTFKIDKSQGLLCLLGFYYGLDVESTCSEETIKAINLTKIIEKDYKTGNIRWNMSLYEGENTDWDWVKDWNSLWSANPDRKASNTDVLKRMQEFFKRYPHIRKEDVFAARDLYFKGTTREYLKNSAAFIFDGAGAMKKSILLGYCEKVKEPTAANFQQTKIVR